MSASFSADSKEFIFRPLVFLRGTGAYKMRGSVSLSYTRAREIVLSAFNSIGLPKQDYGLHSLRSGSASGAANAGCLTDNLKDAAVGNQTRQKTATLTG